MEGPTPPRAPRTYQPTGAQCNNRGVSAASATSPPCRRTLPPHRKRGPRAACCSTFFSRTIRTCCRRPPLSSPEPALCTLLCAGSWPGGWPSWPRLAALAMRAGRARRAKRPPLICRLYQSPFPFVGWSCSGVALEPGRAGAGWGMRCGVVWCRLLWPRKSGARVPRGAAGARLASLASRDPSPSPGPVPRLGPAPPRTAPSRHARPARPVPSSVSGLQNGQWPSGQTQ